MVWRILLLGPIALFTTIWVCAALWIDGPASRVLAGGLAFLYVAATIALFIRLRPWHRAWIVYALLFFAVLAWWQSIPASNDREWISDVARPPTVTFDGDRATIRNIRNFDYESEFEFTERWEERTYDLSKITGVDLFLSYWGSPHIAHTIMSWEFEGGDHLAISIETRKEEGEEYSAVLGFFRQFELYYVAADERDLVRLRTNYRGEQVRLYRLVNVSPEAARAVLEQYLAEMNRLDREARWYNAATHNCTTAIRYHIKQVAPNNPWDWRILVNGWVDEMAYERGSVDTSLPFEELRSASDIGEKARAADDAPDLSARIRQGLPGF